MPNGREQQPRPHRPRRIGLVGDDQLQRHAKSPVPLSFPPGPRRMARRARPRRRSSCFPAAERVTLTRPPFPHEIVEMRDTGLAAQNARRRVTERPMLEYRIVEEGAGLHGDLSARRRPASRRRSCRRHAAHARRPDRLGDVVSARRPASRRRTGGDLLQSRHRPGRRKPIISATDGCGAMTAVPRASSSIHRPARCATPHGGATRSPSP